MSLAPAILIFLLLLFGPLLIHRIERNLELYFLVLGVAATFMGSGSYVKPAEAALTEPLPITAAVVVFALLFRYTRDPLDRVFVRLRRRLRRSLLTAISIFLLGLVSSLITAIVAALLLVEMLGLLRINEDARVKVAVAGCFAIGFGASLTPLGEPLSTLAASGLNLPFHGLFLVLGPYVIPGLVAFAALAGFWARGEYHAPSAERHVEETVGQAFVQGAKVFAFVAGLVLVSEAFEPLALRYVATLHRAVLYWVNIVSAVLDNATLVALEVRGLSVPQAREALISLLISGGLMIPGNIPNIIVAGRLRITNTRWAVIALPVGFVMLAVYFAVLNFPL